MERDALRQQVAEVIAAASDGQVPLDAALAGEAPLTSMGLSSLGFVRLVDALDERYGVPGLDAALWEADAVDRVVERILAAHAG
jgi:acyl carrier protein